MIYDTNKNISVILYDIAYIFLSIRSMPSHFVITVEN